MLTVEESLEILGEEFWDQTADSSSPSALLTAERLGAKEEVIQGWSEQIRDALDGEWESPTWEEVEMLRLTFSWYVQGYMVGLLRSLG